MVLLLDPRHETDIRVALWNGRGVPRFKIWKRNGISLIEFVIKDLQTRGGGLQAILAIPGPGGFSTVRTAATLANTLAFAHGIPVVAVKLKRGEGSVTAFRRALRRVGFAPASVFVEPVYGGEPNITVPKSPKD